MTENPEAPTLMCIGGHDPCGGAGIVADIESARAAGIHAASVVSVLTSQDSCGVRALWPQPAEQVAEQCRTVLADARVTGIKVGLLGGSSVVRALGQIADEHPDLPLVLDPVLASGAGQPMADAAMINQLRNNLLGRATLITPNLPEARTLGRASDPEDCARRLLEGGCRWALITGAHAEGPEVVNRLYGDDGSSREWSWPRLPHDYHGSGCTLASAIAARLAKGVDMIEAVDQAQAFTWRSLQTARRTGRCQLTPNRLHALDAAEDTPSR
jgi:hydroxymethylpyrimidine/phosphomethylpyrimidine kinase